jgi:hypothetical protein
LRVEARADYIKNSAEAEVIANHLREERGVRLRGVGARCEIGDGNARFFYSQAGAGAKPVLLLRLRGTCSREEANE